MNRAFVLASGDCPHSLPAGLKPCGSDQVVCVDGGLVHCLAMGWKPSLLIGDFDSAPAEMLLRPDIQAVKRLSFPPSKDTSDLELALDTLANDDVDEVLILGVSGGRTDHMLFNWMLPARKAWPFSLRLIDDSADALCITAKRPFVGSCVQGVTMSLLALSSCKGVMTRGLLYPLISANMTAGSTLGLSNQSTGAQVEVSLELGTLLVIQVRELLPAYEAG